MRTKHTRDVRKALAALCLAVASASAQSPDTADVAFMRGMIGHHAQAVTMTAMIAERTTNPRFRLLGERIAVSQQDEIASMRRWLTARGLPDPEVGGHDAHSHHASHTMMPGMLSAAERRLLDPLARQLDADARNSSDPVKVRLLADVVRRIAKGG